MKGFQVFSGQLRLTWASRSNVSSKLNKLPDDIKQLNESVWEFFNPPGGDVVPKVEVIFFHGAQLSNDGGAFWKTWLSRDETVVWPTEWLAPKFPGARILFISYDSLVQKSSGQKDMYQTMENLMHNIIWSSTCKAGQKCPVIFVGHCFGGIIIKQFLIRCSQELTNMEHGEEIKMLLQHCKAIFYYSTPNAGSSMMDGLGYRDEPNQSIVDFLKILSPDAARVNMEFSKLRHNPSLKWETRGIVETLETNLRGFKQTMIVPQASARLDMDEIYWANDANHFDVARAQNNTSCNIFIMLHDVVVRYYNMPSSSLPGALKLLSSEHFSIGKSSLVDVEKTVTSPLPFGQDSKYVPIVSSIGEVQNALEKEHECHVVTVHGEAGLGKTSLVKYVALQYSPHHLLQGSRKASLAMFPDGVFYLPCGKGAERKINRLQRELLQILGCESEAEPVNISQGSNGDYESMHMRALRRKLRLKLVNLKALIILDDVWERPVLEELIRRLNVTGSVKYLLTSQSGDIWPDAIKIQMEKPTFEESKQILLKYTNQTPKSTETAFPQNIKNVADKILDEVERIPFAIATLGAQLGHTGEGIMDVNVWNSALENSIQYLNSQPSFKCVDATTLQKSYWSALKQSIDGLHEEKHLFFLVCLCRGPSVCQDILQFFCSIVSSCNQMKFIQWKAKLKSRHLMLEENNGCLSIPSLTKRLVVKFMQGDLESIVQSLVELGQESLPNVLEDFSRRTTAAVIVLVCLYLDPSFGKPQASQIGLPFDSLSEAMRGAIEPIAELLVSEIISRGSWTKVFHKSTIEVFLDFTFENAVHDEQISQLLDLELQCYANTEQISKFLGLQLPGLQLLAMGCEDAIMKTLQFLQNVALLKGPFWQKNTIHHLPSSLLRIFQDNTHLELQVQAARTLATLCTCNMQTRDRIVNTSDMLHQMVHSLTQDQNPAIQKYAALALRNLAMGDQSMKVTILNTPRLLDSLVKAMDQDCNFGLAKQAAGAIVNLASTTQHSTIKPKISIFSTLLAKLGVSLSKDQNPTLQKSVAQVLHNLAKGDQSIKKEIINISGLLDSLVKAMNQDQDSGLAEQAARAICNLSYIEDLAMKDKIACFPNLLESLRVSLSKDQNPPLQMTLYATWALHNLANGDQLLKEKIFNLPQLLHNLVKWMDQNQNLGLAKPAAATIHALACTKDSTMKGKIACVPNLLDSLQVSLSKSQNPALQKIAAKALAELGH